MLHHMIPLALANLNAHRLWLLFFDESTDGALSLHEAFCFATGSQPAESLRVFIDLVRVSLR